MTQELHGGKGRVLEEEKKKSTRDYWALPIVLHYYVCNREFNTIDRLANSINPTVAIQTLYDALRNIESIYLSGGEKKELCDVIQARISKSELDCDKVISIAKWEAGELSQLILESFDRNVMNLLKYISIKALEGPCQNVNA